MLRPVDPALLFAARLIWIAIAAAAAILLADRFWPAPRRNRK